MSNQNTIVPTNGHREVMMMGQYVAVCWPGHYEFEKIDECYSTEKWQRSHNKWHPYGYIDFVWLREDPDGGFYEDEDSPVEGGLDPDVARQIAAELIKAADYIESLKG